jgi:hypothetical protein
MRCCCPNCGLAAESKDRNKNHILALRDLDLLGQWNRFRAQLSLHRWRRQDPTAAEQIELDRLLMRSPNRLAARGHFTLLATIFVGTESRG